MAPPYVGGGVSAGTVAKSGGIPSFKPPKPPPGKPSKPGKPASKPAADPYANPQQYIRNAIARLGTPQPDAQIQASAQGQLSPLIQALTDQINRQAASGTAAIGGYTSDLAKSLAGFQQNAANIYGGAQQSQAASDAVLSAKLSGGGAQQAQDLGAKLASINAPGATNQAVTDATTTATGSGNALYATGSASLADLIASGAAEQSYAGKLPGIAGLAGAQQVGGLQSQLAKSLADKTGDLQAQVPQIVSGLQGQRSDLLNRQAQLRQDLAGFFSDRQLKQQALDQEKQAFGLPDATLSRAYGYAVDKSGNPVGGQVTPLPGYTVGPGGNVVKVTKPKGSGSGGGSKQKPSVTLSERYGYIVDSSGNPILKNGKRQPLPGVNKPTKPLSPTETRKVAATANTIAEVAYKGGQDAKGAPLKPISYQQALDEMRNEGLLADPRSAKLAIAALNRYYGEGERGRPVSKKGKAAFKAAQKTIGTPPIDAMLGGH